MASRVLIGDLDPLVARGLTQTLIEEHFDVLDAAAADGLADPRALTEAVVRLHPDAVIVRMGPEAEAIVRALRARQPALQVVECDDDRPRLRVLLGTAFRGERPPHARASQVRKKFGFTLLCLRSSLRTRLRLRSDH